MQKEQQIKPNTKSVERTLLRTGMEKRKKMEKKRCMGSAPGRKGNEDFFYFFPPRMRRKEWYNKRRGDKKKKW